MSFAATWMGLEIVTVSEVSMTEKRNIILDRVHVESGERLQVNLSIK